MIALARIIEPFSGIHINNQHFQHIRGNWLLLLTNFSFFPHILHRHICRLFLILQSVLPLLAAVTTTAEAILQCQERWMIIISLAPWWERGVGEMRDKKRKKKKKEERRKDRKKGRSRLSSSGSSSSTKIKTQYSPFLRTSVKISMNSCPNKNQNNNNNQKDQ